ncbi:MAG: hypothetical protein COU35_01900 [Candidatus Magasanikbacteria bacterium CG10_big_fil_rev_8_21_14_0_10_47_10]|uniref:Glycosyltransferase family 1 protein n=1 Tax=Candidatus Magasanikbacteria bacterium CG10_big_fil_rev_8_21_14_0_10_47_10 TaxID=1974652 RepID=A0A2H0TQY2_9BACT|nr:MAG: hypothetical protein COU35_01900 [Candidatus Magasanikbacteria bacterium CG10_big_fil_rev_8_21_14_0_10_47_10]
MRIGIDARMMGKGYGLGRYVEELVAQLQQMESDHEFVFLQPDISWYSIEEQFKMPSVIKKAQVDLMHFPHWNVPFFYRGPFVVTIHDLTMYHYPRPEATTLGPILFWIKDVAHRMLIRRVVRKAKHIIVASEFTKQDVHSTLGVPLDKMTVIYQAPFCKAHEADNTTHDFAKYGIDKPFVLYVGAAYPHKNLERLLEAWKIVEDEYTDQYQLVLAGKENYFWTRLRSSIAERQSIKYIGFVPDEDLTLLYKRASLFVFPSLYEGFGLPPLEAMAHDVPVVSANSSCLPEVLGEGALYFNPEDIHHIARMIYQGLTDEDVRAELRANAGRELSRYTARNFGLQTMNVYTLAA